MSRYRIAACALACGLLAASSVGAQSGITTARIESRLESGLRTFLAGHEAILTVTELGPRGVTSRVRLSLYNESDVLVARTEGVLARAQPVRLEFQLPPGVNRAALRATVSIVGDADRGRIAIATFEDVNANTNSITTPSLCGPVPKHDPAVICPGWEATDFVLPS